MKKFEREFKRIQNVPVTDIAERAECSVSYISRVMRGERIPRIHYFVAIAEAIGVPIAALWEFLKHHYKGVKGEK
jgi:transcriptional regulator with XRE-family HTH domain